jgi:hypothetical protein
VRTRAIIITFCAAFAVRYSSLKNAPMVSRRWHRLAFASKITRSFSMAHAISAFQSASRSSGAHWRVRNNRKFRKTLLAAVAVFCPLCLPAQWLPTIKAAVGKPVLQELMGGCSMRCAFPGTTSALVSGKSPQIVYTLDDKMRDCRILQGLSRLRATKNRDAANAVAFHPTAPTNAWRNFRRKCLQ